MNNDKNWFGQRLKAQREKAGYTQLKLSEAMDVSLQTIREWERGIKFPHLRRLPRLAQALGIEAGQFFPPPSQWPDTVSEGQTRSPQDLVIESIEAQLRSVVAELRKLRSD